MSIYPIHGYLQLLIFMGIYPLGMLAAILRSWIGPSWRTIHTSLQLLGSLLFLVSASLVGFALKRDSIDIYKNRMMAAHIWIGRSLLGLVLFQLVWAYAGRRIVEWTTWYYVHIILACLILFGGWINIGLAKLSHATKHEV